jgi:hypothetical protein
MVTIYSFSGNKLITTEIERDPLPYISARPLDDNIYVWHVNLAGPEETAYAGGLFHIELRYGRLHGPTSTDNFVPHLKNSLTISMSLFSTIYAGSRQIIPQRALLRSSLHLSPILMVLSAPCVLPILLSLSL